MTQEPGPDFSARFQVQQRLGQGSMGVVYAAVDRTRDEPVALKTLHRLDPLDLAILKNEFRALVDIRHANLVALHGLFEVSGRWFFSMELVEGTSLIDWLRRRAPATDAPTADADATLPPAGAAPAARPRDRQALPAADVPRLRAVMRQLAEGIAALHAHGLLHRDIKPANALVTPAGRVVLLDFGLAVDAAKRIQDPLLAGYLLGTATYMAPEQAAGQPPRPASDWYSFGAILYEALADVPPFWGEPAALLAIKQAQDPPPLPDGLPADLVDLAMELLDRDPSARPDGGEVLRRLGGRPPPPQRPPPPPLVGRAELVAAVVGACAAVTRGQRVVQHLHGPSGVGKTVAMAAALAALRADGWTVLCGRCHPQERLPFNAIDAVIDELARELVGWSRAQIDGILPRRIHALLRLFPVLARVDGIASFVRERPAPEADVDRQQAIGALRELLARLADRQRLAVFVDDIQWADEDSALLVRALLAEPEPPALAWLSCAHDLDTGPLTPALAGLGVAGWQRAVAPLPAPAARALARSLLGQGSADADAIAAEAGGNPFLIVSTAALARSQAPGAARGAVAEALHARIDALPAEAQEALALVAISGRPLEQEVVLAAVGAPASWRTLALLRSAGMLQYPRLEPAAPVSISHNLLAEAIAQRLDAASLRARHRALATVLAAAGADSAQQFAHLAAGGDRDGALACALDAARDAEAAMALSRSAWFYEQALAVAPEGWDGRPAALEACADALRRAGRGPAAGDAYLRAAAHAAQPARLQLAAAEQLLFSGRFQQGSRLLQPLLDAEGLAAPRLVGTIAGYLLLAVRRARGRRPDPRRCYRADLLRVGLGMSLIRPGAHAVGFMVRAIEEGLASGDPARQLRALSLRRLVHAVGPLGWLLSRRSQAALERFLAAHPDLDARFADLIEVVVTGAEVSSQAGLRQSAVLEARISERGLGLGWEQGPLWLMWCRLALLDGEYAALQRRLPSFLDDLRGQGQRVGAELLQLNVGVLLALLRDQPDRAEQIVDTIVSGGDGESFRMRELFVLVAQSNIDLYRQQPARALARFDAQWPRIMSLGAGRTSAVRATALWSRLGVALAATRQGAPGARADATQCIRSLRWSPFPQSRFWSQLGSATLAGIDGQPAQALARLDRLRRRSPRQIPHSIAQFLRCAEGRIRGGPEGEALQDAARAWAREQGAENPERWIGVFVP